MQPCIVYYISKHDSLPQCLLMLGRGRRRWVYIKSTASRVWSELIWGWGVGAVLEMSIMLHY